MKSFRATSDGTINLDFGTLISNPDRVGHRDRRVHARHAGVRSASTTCCPAGSTAPPPRPTSRPRPAGWSGAGPAARSWPATGSTTATRRPTATTSSHWRTFDGTAFGAGDRAGPLQRPGVERPPRPARGGSTSSRTSTGAWRRPSTASCPTVSSMVFENGRLYYTRTGFAGLYSRPFSVDSGIVGQEQRVQVASGFSDVSGAFLSGGRFFWSTASTGQLRSTPWNNGAPNPAAFEVEDSTRSSTAVVGDRAVPRSRRSAGRHQPAADGRHRSACCRGLTCTSRAQAPGTPTASSPRGPGTSVTAPRARRRTRRTRTPWRATTTSP